MTDILNYKDNVTETIPEDAVSSFSNSSQPFMFCNDKDWTTFHEGYKIIHGCSSLSVCIFGSIANVINIIVLTRPSMISATNAILTALAIADLLVMFEYIPFTLHYYILTSRDVKNKYSWGWAVFVLFHAQFGQVFHTIAISLTVTLAVWRFIAIGYPQHNTTWCSMPRAHIGIASCFVFSLIFNVPNYINLDINEVNVTNSNSTAYVVHIRDESNKTLNTINFIIYSVVLKLLPCVALTGLSLGLIRELLKAARRRAALMKRTNNGKKAEAAKQADRVTRMLLAILILFLISEVPQGIIGLLVVLPNLQFTKCYARLGEIMDMLVLFNSAVNFLLYCSMSQQFRDTFTRLFTTKYFSKNESVAEKKWRRVPIGESSPLCSTTCVTHV